MHIQFGLKLDGYHTGRGRVAFNDLICGPRGLLQLLETRLGLTALVVSPFKRVLQFRKAVVALAGNGGVFFADSCRQDSLATSRVLLNWRDSLIEAGWNGQVTKTDPPRLRDLAQLETIIKSSVAPGEADRLAAVARELAIRSLGDIQLEVLHRKEHLPHLWQVICDQLKATYERDGKPAAAMNLEAASDLERYRSLIQANGQQKFKPKNDGTLLVLTAHSEITLGRAVAQIIHQRGQQDQLTVIAGQQAAILDQALAAEDEPVLGLKTRSGARPIPQLLLLALSLCWHPVDPGALLEFLTHPASPVGKRLRRRLSMALADSPGIGGPKWAEAVASARSVAEKLPEGEREVALKRIDDDLANWILIERFNPETGAPGAKLSEFCRQLSCWAANRSGSMEDGAIVAGQFKLLSTLAFELAVELMDYVTLTRLELEQLLGELSSAGWEGELTEPQLGQVTWVHDPQAVIEPAEQIVWWDFTEPVESKTLPWTKAELQAWEAHGARFTPPDTLAELKVESWMRPILATRKQLILVVAKQRGGKPSGTHPLLTRLLAITDGNPPQLPTRDLDQELYRKQAQPPLTFGHLKHRPLPAPQRWWKLADGGKLIPRETESYSSLEKFIHTPFSWVLTYQAKLKRGPMTTLKLRPDFALKGTLLHRLLDLLLAAPPAEINWLTCDRSGLGAWCGRRWPTLLEQEGATLLLPGNLSESLILLELAKRALWELLHQLRAAKVTSATTNVNPGETAFFGGNLLGYIDLLAINQTGSRAVVDLKLGGTTTREQELKTNRQLQLAVYGYLENASHKSWPAGAFYILGKQRLLAQNADFFPLATVPTLEEGAGLQACWNDFEAVWRWRRQQLDEGWIEVTTTALPEEPEPEVPDSVPPRDHWLYQTVDIRYNDFDALVGWRAEQ